MKKQIVILSLLFFAAGAGCSHAPENNMHSPEHSEIAHVKLAGSRVDLENINLFKPGQVQFIFKLFGLDGHELGLNDLIVAHEKKMHLILVRDDLQGFQHLHPEYVNGKWSVSATIAEEGQYNLYIDIKPAGEQPITLRVPVVIGKSEVAKQFPTPNGDMVAQNGSYGVTLQTSEPLRVAKNVPLVFFITNNGKPESNLQPYLGAFGHVVLLRAGDADDYFHVHPVTIEKPANGIVKFEASFPEAGRYTLFAQFNTIAGVKTFPITVDVASGNEEAIDHTRGAMPTAADADHLEH